MFDRFTDRARKVMSLARQEAVRLHHEYIGTEHVLIGLVQDQGGIAARVLKSMDVDLEKIRLEVEKLISHRPPTVTMGQPPFTAGAKRALELAQGESNKLRYDYIGTEHLLLGLLLESRGAAARVFMNLNIKLDDVRQRVMDALGVVATQEAGTAAGERITPGSKRTAPTYAIGSRGPLTFEKVAEQVQRVVKLAGEDARRFNHEYVGTEHILLALLHEESGVVTEVLKDMSVDRETIRHEVEKLLPYGPPTFTMGLPTFTPRAKRVLELAGWEAVNLGHESVQSEHLLLGLLAEAEGVAGWVLRNLGIRLQQIRQAVLRVRGAPE